MKTKRCIFLLIEFMLYSIFMYIDISQKKMYSLSSYLKFCSILICGIYTCLLVFHKKNASKFITISFIFLMISDYFLLIADRYDIGVGTFIIVQLCYLVYLKGKQSIFVLLQNFLVTAVILAIFTFFGFEVDALFFCACIYFILFTRNVFEIMKRKKTTRQEHYFCIGLLFYFLCDINVAIFNMEDYIVMSGRIFYSIYAFACIAMWLFYLPGIVLITLSNEK